MPMNTPSTRSRDEMRTSLFQSARQVVFSSSDNCLAGNECRFATIDLLSRRLLKVVDQIGNCRNGRQAMATHGPVVKESEAPEM